jgi:hypothetical protein
MYRWLGFGTWKSHAQMTAEGMKAPDETTINIHPRLAQ